MKVTNITAYATIGCNVQLTESDRLALGIELDKVTNWLETVIGDEAEVAESLKAVNKIVAFVSKFAIRPSKSNVFTDDNTEDFKKADETTTADEPDPTYGVITVDISNAKNFMNLGSIIYRVSDASLFRINNLLNSAKENHVPYISFRCINDRKEKVVDEIVEAGYQIVQNGVNQSLRL